MDIVRRRLRSHCIVGEKLDRPGDVVRRLGAMQAQDYNQAVWAVGLRTAEPALAGVERAIADRTIVATWPMRGTIHYVPAQDAAWMLRLMAPRSTAASRSILDRLELHEETFEVCGRLFSAALRGDNRLTWAEMMRVLNQAGIDSVGQRGSHLLRRLAQQGVLCFGPKEGKQQTFVLLGEWVREPRELSREAALAEFTRRYFIGHGPGTAHDFAKWSTLTPADVRLGLTVNESRLVPDDVDGMRYWSGRSEPPAATAEGLGVHLLPGFDEYLLGYKDREAILDSAYAGRVVPGGNGVFRPMVICDGRVIGT
ncbi:MAG TPA: winged helix DNA-binding domain-containing protein [Mycobacteriales bacterium]|jgi:hypothetical protein|nr:winged helix DNA-binding domain-containing protein [Mycobacteriales bacterium]